MDSFTSLAFKNGPKTVFFKENELKMSYLNLGKHIKLIGFGMFTSNLSISGKSLVNETFLFLVPSVGMSMKRTIYPKDISVSVVKLKIPLTKHF